MQKALFQIVVAEDNFADVVLVREALREHRVECEMHVLSDGEQALAFLDATDKRMDLMLLDLNLPKHDGREVLNKLRSIGHYADTPVIVMTAFDANAPEMKQAREIASVCFPKPSTLDEFLQLGAIVRDLLANRQNTGDGPGGATSEGVA